MQVEMWLVISGTVSLMSYNQLGHWQSVFMLRLLVSASKYPHLPISAMYVHKY